MARIVDNTNTLTPAAWMGDFGSRDHLIPGGARVDAAQWETTDYTITATEIAAAGATSITVAALPVAIPSGTYLNWLGADELSVTTAAAAAGATTLAVEALGQALEDNDTATYTVTDASPVNVLSGTVIGRTIAERDAGDDFGPADAADDEIFIVVNDVYDASINPDVEMYRPGSVVKENFLPGWSDLAAGVQTAVRAAYICVRGVA